MPGFYLPTVDEEIYDFRTATVISDKIALHLRAIKSFTDQYGADRKAGDEWLIDKERTDTHILDAYEEVVRLESITILASNQYVVIQNPLDEKTGRPRYGISELRKGERKFFLRPGEEIVGGIMNVIVLQEDDAVLLKAREVYKCP